MEKILSENEKIRRAEEIYFRRNNQNINLFGKNENNKAKRYLGSKVFLNLLVLFNIVIILYCIQNRNAIFKDEFLKKFSEYNINITSGVSEFVNNFLTENSEMIINENIVSQENTSETINIQENSNTDIEQSMIEIKENTGINENIKTNESSENQVSSISQMDDDVDNLKRIYSFISPINGIISSGFGARESEYQNVTGYHTGTDIAADKGTNIVASMEGIVTLVSSKGDYRKAYKNKMQ